MKCLCVLLLLHTVGLSLCDFVSDIASPQSENVSSELEFGVYKVTEELSHENFDTQFDETTDNTENFEIEDLSDEIMVQNDARNNESEPIGTEAEGTNSTDQIDVNKEANERNDSSSENYITSTVSSAASGENSAPDEEKIKMSSPAEEAEMSTTITTANAPSGETLIESNTQTETNVADTEPAVSDSTTEPSTTVASESATTVSKCVNRTGNDNTSYTFFGDRNVSVETALRSVEKGLSNQIRKVLNHYQKVKEVKIPGSPLLPDPLDMPNTQNSFSLASMTFTNMKVYGLSNFTVEHVNTDIDKMQVYVLLHMKRLVILGNYTMRTFFKRASGPFNVTLLDVDSEGAAELRSDSDGQLQATDSEMDMYANDMRLDFKNLGFAGSMFQGMISGIGTFLFDSIKPEILEKVNNVIRNDVNAKIKEVSKKYVNSIKPVDLAVAEARRYVKEKGYDPYHIRNYSLNEGLNITHFVLNGLSKFYRVGNVSLSMDVGVIQVGLHVATGRVTGECEWEVKLGKFYSRVGYANFTIDHVQVRVFVNQSLDVCTHPMLENLDIEVGKVKLVMDRKKPLDIILEYIVNSLPTFIRHVIVDAMEIPIKHKIQEILNNVDVEKLVDDNLPLLDSLNL